MKTMLDIVSLAAPTNTKIVNDIRVLTEFLHLQQQQYRPISDNYLTYYGYETIATALPGGSTSIIVSKLSAVPPTATDSQRIELPADHIRIAKFESAVDETFQALVLPVQATADDSRRRCQERWQKFKGELPFYGQCC